MCIIPWDISLFKILMLLYYVCVCWCISINNSPLFTTLPSNQPYSSHGNVFGRLRSLLRLLYWHEQQLKGKFSPGIIFRSITSVLLIAVVCARTVGRLKIITTSLCLSVGYPVYSVLSIWDSVGYAWEGNEFVGLLDGVLGDIILLMYGGPLLFVLCVPSEKRGTREILRGLRIRLSSWNCPYFVCCMIR